MPTTAHTESSHTDSARINLRTSPEAKALIERAAAIMGTTVSAFMLHHAHLSATRIVLEHELITLADGNKEVFFKAVDDLVNERKNKH